MSQMQNGVDVLGMFSIEINGDRMEIIDEDVSVREGQQTEFIHHFNFFIRKYLDCLNHQENFVECSDCEKEIEEMKSSG